MIDELAHTNSCTILNSSKSFRRCAVCEIVVHHEAAVCCQQNSAAACCVMLD